MFKKNFAGILVYLIVVSTHAQQLLTESEAINKALTNSKNIRAVSLQVKQQQQLLGSAVNLPNPEFFWESPTGNFYTGSITQSFEFPTVYANQYNLRKKQVDVARKEEQLATTELKYKIKLLYLEAQFASSLAAQLYIQDTLYEKIKLSAVRQFNAGQIDYLQQTFAEIQYGEIHNQYLQSISKANAINNQLKWVTGIKDSIMLEPLVVNTQFPVAVIFDSTSLLANPAVELLRQQEIVAKQNIGLQKSKALPGLAFGYFNQGEKNTRWFNRFRFGITIPLWFGQYKSNINAAKTEQEIIKSKQEGLQQELSVQLINAGNEIQSGWQSVQYYQQTGLSKAGEIIATAQRLFASGEIDYIGLLRNSNDAYNVYQKYLEIVKSYNLSIINYQYLMGQL
ncbi:MAG TPA: TolC family protein [Chitinophagaceae bacterium]|nr:TolC family protein [Chitinophagaceae bacterium]